MCNFPKALKERERFCVVSVAKKFSFCENVTVEITISG